jgi:hypothetical protein
MIRVRPFALSFVLLVAALAGAGDMVVEALDERLT